MCIYIYIYVPVDRSIIYIGLYSTCRRVGSCTCLDSYLALSRAAVLESVKATELIYNWRGTTLLHSHGEVRFAWWLSVVDCQPAFPGNLLVVIPPFSASPRLKAGITTGVLVFVSKHYEQDSETENLISCWSHLLITVAYWALYLIKPCQAFYV